MHFGEFFEIFALLIHKKWHHEIVETIEAVEEEVEKAGTKLGNVIQQPAQARHRHFAEVPRLNRPNALKGTA